MNHGVENNLGFRIAALGDIHCTRKSEGALRETFKAASDAADVLLLLGDLTDYGTKEETEVLIRELSVVSIPILGVLGNHDFESGQEKEVQKMLRDAGVIVFDGEASVVRGVGFAGCKGFAGGFTGKALEPWGESIIKTFVHEAVEEALKLESSLARLTTSVKVALLHYSPIRETVVGEHPEIIPFLGSRRLEEPLDRFEVNVVFHGHAHSGSLEGKTRSGIPVYNVAMPLLRKHFPDRLPFRLVTLPMERGDRGTGTTRKLPDTFQPHG